MCVPTDEEQWMRIEYAQAEDYPVDLYYLMDLSKSMEDDKEKLSSLGDLLAESMRNITSNFRLGFGSFVDKVVMPYVSTVPKKLESPCDGCVAPYGFRNHMRLSDGKNFSTEVRNAKVSGNLDAPEGGFDAIMQAVVCRQQIGWREKARRLLVFSTDASFHYAGDGKLGGIVKPNDGKCHLDEVGSYTHSTLQDYPSISQINQKVKDNAINVIFAVTKEQINVYSSLQKNVEGSSSGVLSEDSSNVVDFVRDQYNKITSSVELKHNSTDNNNVQIKYYSSCVNDVYKETNKCDGLKVGTQVEFQAELKVTRCPEDPRDWKQVIQIYPIGISEALLIDLEILCDCPCERTGSELYEEKSAQCSSVGTYMCGVCKCDDQHFGRMCQCGLDKPHTGTDVDTTGCRALNSTLECSGRGTCDCGVCSCTESWVSGEYCQCDNRACDHYDNKLCADHGTCECGICKCYDGWKGSSCSCTMRNDSCINKQSSNMEVCSGNGMCECGECVCNQDEEGRPYDGVYCEIIPATSGKCLEFRDCIQCLMYKTGPIDNEEDCASNCTAFSPQPVKTVKADEDKYEFLCTYYDEDDCRFAYMYTYKDHKLVVMAQEERECPPEINILGIVLGVIGAIVLIGLALLLLWKLLTTIHDRREFARFEKERMMAKWDTGENPIYKQATSTFKNPTYAGK
ncbi:hypothetical protein PR048_018837 [Dryococelus australis]|uniref:Integrin beta n=1 Tax=Dryococelus australis TaxID=614101 RepID=A0ABQ9H1W7_9NEOP|nr:hypothetical protein PR048_018837 [Dryococelus australis]